MTIWDIDAPNMTIFDDWTCLHTVVDLTALDEDEERFDDDFVRYINIDPNHNTVSFRNH